MKMSVKTLSISVCIITCFTMAMVQHSDARPWRPDQAPNAYNIETNGGDECMTCHINGGGTERNAFGLDVEAIVTPNSGEPFWSAELAQMDSDGDGFSNGEELQDPEGTWSEGDPDPGDISLVTHPGDPNSFPQQTEPGPADAWVAVLSGANVNPPIETDARGLFVMRLNEEDGSVDYYLNVFDLENVTASHIHLGAEGENGGVEHPLETPTEGFSSGQLEFSPEHIDDLRNGLYYVNVHTEQHGGGEIRGQLEDEPLEFTANLTGDQENPPVETDASGMATLMLSEDLTMLSYDLTIMDIENVTAAHIHEAPRGENGGVIFPIADGSFENASDEVELNEEQLNALLSENYYINVHTEQNGGGEIRGQIMFDAEDAPGPSKVNVNVWQELK